MATMKVCYTQGRRNAGQGYQIAVTTVIAGVIRHYAGFEPDNEDRSVSVQAAVDAGEKSPEQMCAAGWHVGKLVRWAQEAEEQPEGPVGRAKY
jgi:hypothetical protein